MVLRAMYSGVSGLRAEGEALGVVGDNIANVNTTGFKGQRVLFEDVLGHSILAGTTTALPGSGVRVADVQQMFTQGALSATGVSTDMALNGDGFFTVKGSIDGITGNFFTRAGEFKVNNDGYIVNTQGLMLQGYKALPDGTYEAAATSIQVPTTSIPAFATENLSIAANLDANAALLPAFDPNDPTATSNFSTSMTVFDSLGNARQLDVYFSRTGTNAWEFNVLADGADVTGGTAGTNFPLQSGTLTFNTDGSLAGVTGNTITANFVGATPGQIIAMDLGTPAGPGSTGLGGMSQFGSPSNVASQSQDGYTSGDFSGLGVDGQGVVMGLYTNGQKLPIAQLAIARFQANEGLGRAGGNMWIQTRESGEAAMGTAGSGGRASVSGGAIEASNVDLAEQFVQMIQHQRSFSANSKTITTADEMLQELINIKR